MTTFSQPKGLRHPAVLAWLRLVRVFRKVEDASAQHFRRYRMPVSCQGLNSGLFDVLAHIGAAEGITQQELADSLLVTKGNVSQLLTKLENEGLIARHQEGRSNCLTLTAAGRMLYEQVVPQQEALVAELFAPLTPAEQATLLELLRKLDRTLAA